MGGVPSPQPLSRPQDFNGLFNGLQTIFIGRKTIDHRPPAPSASFAFTLRSTRLVTFGRGESPTRPFSFPSLRGDIPLNTVPSLPDCESIWFPAASTAIYRSDNAPKPQYVVVGHVQEIILAQSVRSGMVFSIPVRVYLPSIVVRPSSIVFPTRVGVYPVGAGSTCPFTFT